MRLLAKIAGLSALAACGVLLAVALPAQGRGLATTTDTTTTDTTTEASTAETTVVSTVESTAIVTTTVEQTTTRQIIVPTLPTTTESSSSESGTPVWVWVLLAILAVGLVVFAVLLARRSPGMSRDERRRRLDAAVVSWVAQGWAIESQDAESAVLRRVEDLVLVQVDAAGHVTARPLGPQ
jgi:hypothetical protein